MRLAALALAALSAGAAAQGFETEGGQGRKLPLRLDLPTQGQAPFPTLVLAPGGNYHLDLPILTRLAQELPRRGIAVLRFNWGYFAAQPRGQSSEGQRVEREDLLAVLAWARQQPQIDAARLHLGGKSLGSGVAWQVAQADPGVRSVLLLTPICSERGEPPKFIGAEVYPGLTGFQRPLALALGDQDSACRLAPLQAWLAQAARTPRLLILGGNHGLESRGELPAQRLDALTNWVADFLLDPPSKPL